MKTIQVIGYSEKRSPIEVTLYGRIESETRLLIIAGQHGDESLAREAVEAFTKILEYEGLEQSNMQVAVILNINPDGAEGKKRLNEAGIDLNRDHQLLNSLEVQALHQFVRSWKPHMVIDVHTYPPRRKHLLKDGLIYCHDVFLDTANNLSISPFITNYILNQCVNPIIKKLKNKGIRADRYTLIKKSGRIRHSTKDIVDARNGLALRYGCRTILLEGRNPLRKEDLFHTRRILFAMKEALRMIVSWAAKNRQSLSPLPNPSPFLVINSRYVKAESPRKMLFRRTDSELIEEVELNGAYTPQLRPLQKIILPTAYAVPTKQVALIDVLKRHGLEGHCTTTNRSYYSETYWINKVIPSTRPNRTPKKLNLTPSTSSITLAGYRLYPVTYQNAPALAAWLEPQSEFSFHRFPELNIDIREGSNYPICRVF